MYFLLAERKVGIWKNKIPYCERNSNLKIRFFAYVAKKLSALKKNKNNNIHWKGRYQSVFFYKYNTHLIVFCMYLSPVMISL